MQTQNGDLKTLLSSLQKKLEQTYEEKINSGDPRVLELQSTCSVPECRRGYIYVVEDGYEVSKRCPECESKYILHRIQCSKEKIILTLGDNYHIPVMERSRLIKTHPAYQNARAAFKLIKTDANGNPVGGIGLNGCTGSGKTTAMAALAGKVIECWPRINFLIYKSTAELINELVWNQSDGIIEKLHVAHAIFVDEFRPRRFKSQDTTDYVLDALHSVIDRAYSGEALLVVASSCSSAELNSWLIPDTARRLGLFGPKGAAKFEKDSGCPWS